MLLVATAGSSFQYLVVLSESDYHVVLEACLGIEFAFRLLVWFGFCLVWRRPFSASSCKFEFYITISIDTFPFESSVGQSYYQSDPCFSQFYCMLLYILRQDHGLNSCFLTDFIASCCWGMFLNVVQHLVNCLLFKFTFYCCMQYKGKFERLSIIAGSSSKIYRVWV